MKLILHPDALRDLERIRLLDDLCFKRVLAVFQQAKQDKDFFSKWRQHAFKEAINYRLDVKQWKRLQKLGDDVWRIRLPDLEMQGRTYRVVYAFKKQESTVHMLAIVPREDVNYDDPDHPFGRRIRVALDKL